MEGTMAALGTEEVLQQEVEAIHGTQAAKKIADKTGTALYQELNNLNSAALCLSGGGIRSAAFALGVIQALATHPRPAKDDNDQHNSPIDENRTVARPEDSLLAKFHYLSTVSGGGYIGSWLSAWISRIGFPAVWSNLVGRPGGPDIEPQTIAWLRAYGNYLTPKLGIASADSWTAIAIVLRNLILNWLVILPVICLLLLGLKLLAILIAWFSQFDPQSCRTGFSIVLIVGIACLIFALRFSTKERPTRGESRAGQTRFLWLDWLPAVLSALFLSAALASPCAFVAVRNLAPPDAFPTMLFAKFALFGSAIYAVGWALALPKYRGFWDYVRDFIAWAVSGAVYGSLMALGIYLYIYVYGNGVWYFKPAEVLLVVFAVPWALTAQLTAEMVFVGLTSWETDSDSDREWFGRAAGWLLVTALGWLVLMFLVFVGSTVAAELYKSLKAWIATAGAGGVTALLGKSSLTPAKGPAKDNKGLSANIMLAIVAPVFAGLLIIMTSAILDQIMYGKPLIETPAFRAPVTTQEYPLLPGGWPLFIAIAIAIFIGVVAWARVNINRFSLHALYRDRLIRAFLGASRAGERHANPFTDFDIHDNPRMHELWPPQTVDPHSPNTSKAGERLFHVVNIALNIVSTKRLAWQERKAESFTVTARHSGTACGRTDPNLPARGTYRPSEEYGNDKGISLGTAMAISGAAASPNMGYNSSPPLAFLLTLFNVRLGWWLGNPVNESKKIYSGEGPQWAIKPLLDEMFGQTTDDAKYVYLSDGGHFENLGMYEMVRRRCRLIVVSDAGCDPDFAFEDLGNAVRKIALDLGVTITLHKLETLKRRGKSFDVGADKPYCAFGEINYPGAEEPGFLLYIKPCYHGVESASVRAYAIANPSFPHQTTGDQFFSESQFESYRVLGFEVIDKLLNKAFTGANRPTTWSPKEMAGALKATLTKLSEAEAAKDVVNVRAEMT
jgi:hypothetical protein